MVPDAGFMAGADRPGTGDLRLPGMDETFEHQELRGRQTYSLKAVLAAALTAGGITFIMSGGAPWTTAGTMNAIMGRHFELNVVALLVIHLLVAILYSSIIAAFIYQMKLGPSLGVGVLVGMGLYLVNYMLLHNFSAAQGGNPEVQAVGAHFTFSLFAAAVYRASSVPRRIVNTRGSEANAPVPGSNETPNTDETSRRAKSLSSRP